MAEKIVEGEGGELQVTGEAEPDQQWERAAADTDAVEDMEGEDTEVEDMEGEAPTG
jgi:hypothetical protein